MTRRQALSTGVGAVALAGLTPELAGAGLPAAPDQLQVPRSAVRVLRSPVHVTGSMARSASAWTRE
jgi:hypothetical protein